MSLYDCCRFGGEAYRTELLYDTPKVVISSEAFGYVKKCREGGNENRGNLRYGFQERESFCAGKFPRYIS